MSPGSQQPLAHALFPDLAARARLAEPGAGPVERAIAAQLALMRSGAFGAALARFPAGTDAAALAAAFGAAAWIAARCGIRCPDPEELFAAGASAAPRGPGTAEGSAAAGVNWGAGVAPDVGEGEGCSAGGDGPVAEAEADGVAEGAGVVEGDGSAPVAPARASVVAPTLLPVPAPHGLGAAAWLRCFGGAAAQTAQTAELGVPEELASRASKSGGPLPSLALSSEVARWFAALDQPGDPETPTVTLPERVGPITWTLRWIPGDALPPRTGHPLRAADAAHSPTLPELLTLQVMRVRRGEIPVDARSFTWLAGELPDARFAARHGYDSTTHTIRIGTRERTDQGPHVGTRRAR